MLQGLFNPQEVDLIQSIPLFNSLAEDKLIWPYTSLGQYTRQSGFKFLDNESLNNPTIVGLNQDNGVWKLVWGLSVPNKVKKLPLEKLPERDASKGEYEETDDSDI